MARYICKCGRVVNKSTNADNTGNRNTDGCEGCPYLLPWGPTQWDNTRHAMVTEVKGYECRMSPSLEYATYYQGNGTGKCVLHIYSLDYDFLERLSTWVAEQFPEKEISCSFDRSKIRATEFVGGLYGISVYPMQNKRGIAAKAALLHQFFDNNGARLDMTPEQEKAHILAAIEAGKAAYQRKKENMEYIISENLKTSGINAYYDGRFWVYSKTGKEWFVSDLAADEYRKALAEDAELTPEDFMASSDVFVQMEDWEITTEMVDSLLCAAKATHPRHAEEPDANPTQAAPDSPAGAGAATQSLSAAAPASLAADTAPAFDYTGLPDKTVEVLHLAATEVLEARQIFVCRVSAAVALAHKELVANCDEQNNQHSEKTFISWCASVGLKKDAAYRLLHVDALLSGATPEEQATLEAASPSLLYAAAKPSAPAELVQAVKDGDITTHKQFKELEAQLKAAKEAQAKAEQQLADAQHAHQAERESTSAMLREEQQRRQAAEERRIAAEKDKADARQQAKEAQARGKQDAALVEKLQNILLQRDNKLAEQEAQLGRISFSLEDAGRRIQEQADTIQELEAELDQKDEVIRQQGRQPLEAVAVVDQDEVQRQARLLAQQSLPPVCNLLTLLQSSIQQAWDLSGLAGRHAADEEDESACVLLRQYLLSLLSEISDIAGWEEKA